MVPDSTASSASPVALLKARLLRLSGAIIGLATGAELVGKSVNAIDRLRHFVIEAIGLQQLVNIHQALVIIVGAALLAGYAFGAWWLYLKIRRQPVQMRIGYVALAVLGMGTMAWINFKIIPPRPDPELYLNHERAEWGQRVLGSQDPQGGIRVISQDSTARPQVWTTAQALTGVLSDPGPVSASDADRVRKAFGYIERSRLSGSGGWGYFEDWPWSITEVTSWVVLAEVRALERGIWPASQRSDIIGRVNRDLATVSMSIQDSDKGWSPVITSSQGISRTYSTLMATLAFIDAQRLPDWSDDQRQAYVMHVRDGSEWLLKTFKRDPRKDSSSLVLGWVANPYRSNQQESFLGLNAQVLYVLEQAAAISDLRDLHLDQNFGGAVDMFLAEPSFGTRSASLNDRLHDTDRYLPISSAVTPSASGGHAACSCPLTIEGSTFLWYPWSVAAAQALAADGELAPEQRQRASAVARLLVDRLSDSSSFVSGEFNYVDAEYLLGVSPTRPEVMPLRASLR
ncbi:MAG TPA: hypothetical protein VLV86_23675 [Vicinamibacterales bacterium]|nr:hypothetical protein [Vicinamibacterales bacterium]